MIFKTVGSVLSKNTKTKTWWIKMFTALIISNIFFFLLFSGNEDGEEKFKIPDGWVAIQVKAELLTPFQTGKKILLLNRAARKYVEGVLESTPSTPEERFIVWVKEDQAENILMLENWEIVPFLKTLSFTPTIKGIRHEISY